MKTKGFLCPLFALPSEFGIGDFSKEAFSFIDILTKHKFTHWQLLPLNPISYGNSPYQPFSSYALEELYVDISEFKNNGLLDGLSLDFAKNNDLRIDYNKVKTSKYKIYEYAFDNYLEKYGEKELREFAINNPRIEEFATFMAFKDKNKQESFLFWKDTKMDELYKRRYYYHLFLQKTALEQYLKLKEYANKKGIKLIGDLPFYVGLDSSDVYFNKNFFLLNKDNTPKYIAGVAPDYFSKDGQRWGNPIYNFKRLKEDNYKFLIDRIVYTSKLFDIVRLDHFRAFDTYYKIDAKEETARNGKWILGPGSDFFNELYETKKDINIIAEDLGDIRPEVLELRDKYHLPGMNILEFNIFAIMNEEANYQGNYVTYIGTHDNDTLVGWYNTLKREDQQQLIKYLHSSQETIYKDFIKHLLNNYSFPILSITDILYFNTTYRINYPSTLNEANWSLKLKDFNILIKNLEELDCD